jgi:hypothetical protein
MTIRPATALTALALAAVATTSLSACGGGDTAPSASAPKTSPIAAVVQDTAPLAKADFRAAYEGPLSGSVVKDTDVECRIANESTHVVLNGRINGVATEIDIDTTDYTKPATFQAGDTDIDVSVPGQRRDWRNNSSSGTGTVTYAGPDGTSGSFDLTVPEISWDTAGALPNASQLHLVGRWTCGTVDRRGL